MTLCLNIGAWEHRIPGYVGIDANPTPAADVIARVPPLGYDDGAVAHIYAGHFLEHLPPWDVRPFLAECWRVLEPGGTLTLITPDARRVGLMSASQVMSAASATRVLLGAEGADMGHWTLWTPARLCDVLTDAGFRVDTEYSWREDERMYDRRPLWQAGIRGIK